MSNLKPPWLICSVMVAWPRLMVRGLQLGVRGKHPAKMLKAAQLLAAEAPIKLLTEDDFYRMLHQ